MTRSYRLNKRAESQDRTRQRIVDAAIELHQSKGLSATFGEIAQRANVGKVTVYRHFPDLTALVGACSGQYFERHPLPDVEAWRDIGDAAARSRHGLAEAYRYHRETEPMMARILAEVRDMPIIAPYSDHWRRGAEILAEAWPVGDSERDMLRAGFGLALSFDTWRLLVREEGLDDDRAIALMMRLICDC